jgi:hypothetical protein
MPRWYPPLLDDEEELVVPASGRPTEQSQTPKSELSSAHF